MDAKDPPKTFLVTIFGANTILFVISSNVLLYDYLATWYDYLATWADKHHDAIEALSAIGGFVLTAVLVLSTVGLWIVTKAAANAAKAGANAAETAAKAAQAANQLSLEIFRAERRPIISVELDAHKDILWNGGSVETTVKVTLQNHGNSPADLIIHQFPVMMVDGLGRV